MADPKNSSEPHVADQDGAVRDVDDPDVQQDTASGGAPDEPDTPEEPADAGHLPEDSAS